MVNRDEPAAWRRGGRAALRPATAALRLMEMLLVEVRRGGGAGGSHAASTALPALRVIAHPHFLRGCLAVRRGHEASGRCPLIAQDLIELPCLSTLPQID